MQDVLDNLIAARAVIADEANWCRGARHQLVSVPGHTIAHPFRKARTFQRYCAVGSIEAVTGEAYPLLRTTSSHYREVNVLDEVALYYFGLHLVQLNDWQIHSIGSEDDRVAVLGDDHTNVLFCFDKAIAGVKAVMADAEIESWKPEPELLPV